jgi:hypothetical protein
MRAYCDRALLGCCSSEEIRVVLIVVLSRIAGQANRKVLSQSPQRVFCAVKTTRADQRDTDSPAEMKMFVAHVDASVAGGGPCPLAWSAGALTATNLGGFSKGVSWLGG